MSEQFTPELCSVAEIEPGFDIDIIADNGSNLGCVYGTNNFPCLDEQDAAAAQPEIEATARLWAAAPDLLAACIAARELFDGDRDRGAPVAAQVRAAITKAEQQ